MSKKLKKIRDTIEHLSDKDIDILLYLMKQNEDELPQQHIQSSSPKRGAILKKISLIFVISLAILLTSLLGGVAFSKDFRHMVFNTLEGDEKMGVSSTYEQAISEEDLKDIMRPTALDGQDYSVYIVGNVEYNYSIKYYKGNEWAIFDVRRGMAQSFFDTEHTGWEEISINGNQAYLSLDDSDGTISLFMQNGLSCTISGSFDRAQLITLAYSISINF